MVRRWTANPAVVSSIPILAQKIFFLQKLVNAWWPCPLARHRTSTYDIANSYSTEFIVFPMQLLAQCIGQTIIRLNFSGPLCIAATKQWRSQSTIKRTYSSIASCTVMVSPLHIANSLHIETFVKKINNKTMLYTLHTYLHSKNSAMLKLKVLLTCRTAEIYYQKQYTPI